MFRVRSRDATESASSKSSGDTSVDVMDNFSRFAKPSCDANSGRRMSVNEMSTRRRFGTSGIKALIEVSDREVWRSLNVRRAGREKGPLVSSSVCSFATAASVYKAVRIRAMREVETKIDPAANTGNFQNFQSLSACAEEWDQGEGRH